MDIGKKMSFKRKKISFWKKRRYLTQLSVLFIFFLLPTPLPVSSLKQGLLRLDFDHWIIYFMGVPLPRELFYLFFLSLLLLMLALFVFSAVYGKVFCGWVCPQNSYFEFLENIHKAIKKRFPLYRKSQLLQKTLDFTLTCIFAGITSWNINRYFVGLNPIFQSYIIIFPFLFFLLLVHFFKHKFCKNACPLGIFQNSLQDNLSLHISYDAKRQNKPCGVCYACEKACYVNIDIKKPFFQPDCTLCGACIDACSQVYKNKKSSPLLGFSFKKKANSGLDKLGLNQKMKVAAALLFFISAFCYLNLFFNRPELYTFLQSTGKMDLSNESPEYSFFAANLTGKPQSFSLEISTPSFVLKTLKGESNLSLPPLERKRFLFYLTYTGLKDSSLHTTEVTIKVKNATKDQLLSEKTIYYHHRGLTDFNFLK
jgi:hypothetical protein